MLLHECCDNHAMNMSISLMRLHECGYIHVTALMGMEMDMTHVHECCNIKEALSYMLEDY